MFPLYNGLSYGLGPNGVLFTMRNDDIFDSRLPEEVRMALEERRHEIKTEDDIRRIANEAELRR